jgi:DNA (cytosine-5)-methyltransferase 1
MLKIVDLFAGIGSQSQALKNIGVEHEVTAISEIDKYAIKSYEALHGAVNNLGDITKISRLPEADLWTYSFPCQDISVAGKGKGLSKDSGTRSGLLWEVERLLNIAKEENILPKYLLLENVKNLVSKKFKADFDSWLSYLSSLGYANYWQVLNAKDYGIPQNRERVFVVSILGEHKPYLFPKKKELTLRLKDMIDQMVEEKYYLRESTIKSILASTYHSRRDSIRDAEGVAACLRQRDFHEPQCVMVGDLVGGKWDKVYKMSKRVFSPDGISPTVHCQGGGNTELKIVAMRGRNPDNPSDRTPGGKIVQRFEENTKGTSNAITTVQKDNLLIDGNFVSRKYGKFIEKKGYIPEMFVAYNSQEIKDIAPTITTQCNAASGSSAVLKLETKDVTLLAPNNWEHKAADGTATRKRRETEICPALQANAGQTQQSYLKIKVANKKGYDEAGEGDYVNITYPNSNTKRGRVGKGLAHTLTTGDGNAVITENVRIRKLTPRECLRLMGWKDDQIDRIQNAGISNTQQYRQAGNGIVVNVLEEIYKALFLQE